MYYILFRVGNSNLNLHFVTIVSLVWGGRSKIYLVHMRSITKVTKKSGVLFLSRLPKGWTSFPSPAHTYSGSNFARCTRRSASVRRPAEVVKVVWSPNLCLKKWMEPLHCITWSFSLMKGSLLIIAITKLNPLSTIRSRSWRKNQDPRNSSQNISSFSHIQTTFCRKISTLWGSQPRTLLFQSFFASFPQRIDNWVLGIFVDVTHRKWVELLSTQACAEERAPFCCLGDLLGMNSKWGLFHNSFYKDPY